MSGTCKLVPSSGTYLCSMQGNMCRITTLIEGPLLVKNGESSFQIYVKRIFLDRHETRLGYMADNQSQEASIRLNKESKNYDNAITT